MAAFHDLKVRGIGRKRPAAQLDKILIEKYDFPPGRMLSHQYARLERGEIEEVERARLASRPT